VVPGAGARTWWLGGRPSLGTCGLNSAAKGASAEVASIYGREWNRLGVYQAVTDRGEMVVQRLPLLYVQARCIVLRRWNGGPTGIR
jgi:hypothetical protein